MNITTYQQAAQRTVKPLGSLMLDMTHMCLGMNTEIGELSEAINNEDMVNIAEEIGDAMWYIVNYATLRGITLNDEVYSHPMSAYSLIIAPARLADFSKRWLAYGQELENQKNIENEESLVKEFISRLENLANQLGFDIEEIMAKNILKLYVRYPEKFTEDAALVRDLEAEKAVLEGKIND